MKLEYTVGKRIEDLIMDIECAEQSIVRCEALIARTSNTSAIRSAKYAIESHKKSLPMLHAMLELNKKRLEIAA